MKVFQKLPKFYSNFNKHAHTKMRSRNEAYKTKKKQTVKELIQAIVQELTRKEISENEMAKINNIFSKRITDNNFNKLLKSKGRKISPKNRKKINQEKEETVEKTKN